MSTEPVYATSLDTAKEGEFILFRYGGKTLERITRTTASVIEVGPYKFNRQGWQRGGSRYHEPRICVTTPEDEQERRDEEERQSLARRFRDSRGWSDMTLDQLRQVSALCLSFQKNA